MEKAVWLGGLAAALAVVGAAAPGTTLRGEIDHSLRIRDHEAAARLLDQYLDRHPTDAVMLYNAACVECRRGDLDRGATLLIRAVKAGFTNISHVRRDPDLRPLHEHPVYRAIVAARDAADPLIAERRLREWRQLCSEDTYRFDRDEQQHLSFLSPLDEHEHASMRRMLSEHADIVGPLFGAGDTPTHHVVVVLPTEQDARRFLDRPAAGGVYRHERRELIAADAERSLRHEFVHVLHHRHMDALGQEHPLWIQEGLALAFEDYRLDGDGSLRIRANDRHGMVRMLAGNDRLIPLEVLFGMNHAALRREAIRAYPQLRSVFRFLAERGYLRAWYGRYTAGYDEDPTGVASLERTFGRPAGQIEQEWRHWLESQPATPAP